MASSLEELAKIGQEEPGGPQPVQPTEKATAPTLEGLASKKPSSDREADIKIFLEKRKPPTRQEEAKALTEQFKQDKMRDSLLGINVGIAQSLDLPFEVSAMILRQIPGLKGVRGDPFSTLFKGMGFSPEAGDAPDSAEFDIGKVVGNTIGTLPLAPLGAGIAVTAETGVAKRIAKTIGETAVAAPKSFAATEVLSATGAGLGMEAAQTNFPDSPAANFIGGLIGGFAPAITPLRTAVNAGRAIKRQITNFTQKGKVKAAKEIEKAATDLDAAGERLDNPQLIAEANATAAQKTGDPGLLSLERSIIDRSHNSIFDADEQIAKMNQAVNESLRAPESSVETTRATLENQKQYVQSLMDTNLKMAARNADDAISKLGPSGTADQANAIARREVEAVETLARVDEKTLWNAVPKDVRVSASTASSVLQKELLNRGRTSDVADFPEELDLKRFLGDFHIGKRKQKFFKGGILTKDATMGELQEFRSRILRSIREERAKPASNNNKIRILDDLQEALLQDMGALTGGQGTPGGQSLRLALDYSRKVNETFNRGILGKLKGVDKAGTASIPESLTLETAFGGKPAKAAENIRQIIRASKGVEGQTPPSQDLLGAMEDFIKTDFQKRVIRGDKIDTFKGEQYLERNIKILDEFPEIRDDINRAIKTEDVRAIRQRRSASMQAKVPVSKMSKAALFIEKSPRKMFESIEAGRPEAFNTDMNNIMNKVNKDTSGEALEGLQISFFDWIRQRATSGATDASGLKVISGQALDDLVNNSKIAAMMGKILNKGQIERLRKITNTARTVEAARNARPVNTDVLEAGESKLITTIARIVGAKSGAALSRATGGGAGGLQTAAIMSERFKAAVAGLSIRDPATRLLLDAFADDTGELLKALLVQVRTAKQADNVTAKLHAWAAAVAFESGDKALAESVEER